MLVTLRDVLAMPVVRAAEPRVLAADDQLDRRVRWVHAAEVADIGPLLRPGDLVLSTGIALPEASPEATAFAASLAEAGAAGLLVELGRRWREVPTDLVEACRDARLPLVELRRETRFAAITQAVGERVVDEQLDDLRDAERVHETFTELSLAEAGPAEVLDAVQRIGGAAVVLESEQHQVLDFRAGPGDVSAFLADWQSRSSRVPPTGRTSWDESAGWLVTRLGPRERGWGRLALQCPHPPSQRLVVLVERAAAALALHRLHDRDRDNLLRRSHHELVLALLTDPTGPDVVRRSELAGFPTERRTYVGLTVRPRLDPEQGRRPSEGDVVAAVVRAAHDAGVPALVCEMDRDLRVLLALAPASSEPAVVDRVVRDVSRRHRVVVGAGRGATSLGQADRTLRESRQVVDAVPADSTAVLHRLDDVHLRGLLALFADDDRLRLYVGRELAPLREHDAVHGTDLVDVLRALVTHPSGKAHAAASLHLSRPAFYARLAKIESVLGASLDDPDLRVSLHVALIAEELAGG